MMQGKEKVAPVPGVLATIAAGFDLTARHFWLLLIPVLLDSFFWLGPRLSFRLLVERLAAFWQQEAAAAGVNMDLLLTLAPRTNLFTSLSVPLLGVPALMAGMTPEKTPLPATIIELESGWVWALLLVGFSLVGLLFTAVYLVLTAYVVRRSEAGEPNPWSAGSFVRRVGLTWLKLLGLGLAFIVVAMVLYMPLVIVGTIVIFFSQTLASLVLMAGPVILTWLLVYLSFTPHGLVLNGRPLGRAMIESVQLMRHYMLPAISLLLLVLMIGRGLDWVLLLADDGTWLTWASIWGHAFVSTALLAATFIFYRDRYAPLFASKESTGFSE